MAFAPALTLDPLPLELEPGEGESASGFCLRSVRRHGLSMHWLRRHIGLPYSAPPTRDQSSELAHVLQASSAWLNNALPCRPDLGTAGWDYRGHRVFASSHLRFRHPQVCAACLHVRGQCLALWDFAFYTVCSEHGQQLVDHCRFCKAKLSWNRPGTEVCSCGRFIQCGAEPSAAGDGGVIAKAIAAHLRGAPFDSTAFERVKLPALLADLSLNGLMCVIHAFGELDAPGGWVGPSVSTRTHTTAQWSAILERACSRLRLLDASSRLGPGLAQLVCPMILKRLTRYPLSLADLQIGKLLYSSGFGNLKSEVESAREQLELFS